jgi:hypothetical protein
MSLRKEDSIVNNVNDFFKGFRESLSNNLYQLIMKPKFIVYIKGGKSLAVQSYIARQEGVYYSLTDKPIGKLGDSETIDTSSCGFIPAINVDYVNPLETEENTGGKKK